MTKPNKLNCSGCTFIFFRGIVQTIFYLFKYTNLIREGSAIILHVLFHLNALFVYCGMDIAIVPLPTHAPCIFLYKLKSVMKQGGGSARFTSLFLSPFSRLSFAWNSEVMLHGYSVIPDPLLTVLPIVQSCKYIFALILYLFQRTNKLAAEE
jgi:hypothetical protein